MRRLPYVIVAGVFVVVFGTAGYMIIENAGFLDSLYMTVITITTVGYREVFDLSPAGKIFTLILIMSGVGVILTSFGLLTQVVVEGQFRQIYGRRKMERKITALRNHYIVCGFGRVGSLVCRELTARNVPLVVIEKRPERVAELEREQYLYVVGDSGDENVLLSASIEHAKGLILCLSTDADAVFAILVAKDLNPDLFILARAQEEHAERKLVQAGANRIISPYSTVGTRMANAILRPAVVDLLEITSINSELGLVMEGVIVNKGSRLEGKTLLESEIKSKLGLIIIGIRKEDGMMVFNPESDETIMAGDTLITMGHDESVRRLGEWAS